MNPFRKIIDKNFHALTNSNYRYFWLGQCVSLIGTWMQSIGQTWLVYSLTNSPLLLGVLGAMQYLPVTILTLFAGVWIDKFPKKIILIATQSISMLLALTLAVLAFTNSAKYEYILILAVLLGITNAIDMPARQSFMIEIAGREDLMNAIALNSVTFNLAKILGPSIGAVLLATIGTGWCFLINGLSFIAVIYGLFHIKVRPFVRPKTTTNILKEIMDGLRYIYKSKVLFQTVLLILVIGLFGFNYNILIPVFVKNVLHQDASAFGVLMAALGVGSVIGALNASRKGKALSNMKFMIICSLIIGVFLFLNGFSTIYAVTIIILLITGAASIFFSTTANTTLQLNSANEYRGRVMSVYSLVFAGATPIGSIFAGAAISGIGISRTFLLSGILIISLVTGISLIFYMRHSRS